jgi:hypothetical protein
MNCPSCGKPMKKQGGQETCMNDKCPAYLESKTVQKHENPISQLLAEQK